jgi:ribosome-associated protein
MNGVRVRVNERLSIREEELSFAASRSSGPGGQNVNKLNTRVTLYFDVASSPSLSEDQKRLILSRLATRISKRGVLSVVSQRHRSQSANREAAVERFVELLQRALEQARPRKKTRVPFAARQRRLEAKTRRSRLKQRRSQKATGEE